MMGAIKNMVSPPKPDTSALDKQQAEAEARAAEQKRRNAARSTVGTGGAGTARGLLLGPDQAGLTKKLGG